MDFIEAIDLRNEICLTFLKESEGGYCNNCPLAAKIEETYPKEWMSCEAFMLKNPKEMAEAIEEYKRNKPIYPTLGEVIRRIALLMEEEVNGLDSLIPILNKRLTREAAEYFNILPINSNTLTKSNV